MTSQDPYLREVFPQPPLTAYRRPPNIRDRLIKAKVPKVKKRNPIRSKKGMKKCNKSCPACPFIKEGTTVEGPSFKWQIIKNVDCNTSNVVYLIECKKETCRQRYIGETDRPIRYRISEHVGYVRNNHLNQATGMHFNTPGHSIGDLSITVLEKVKKLDTGYRKEREKHLIQKFNTYYQGLNKQP